MKKGLIFDMDDTLIDSSPAHLKAFEIVFKDYNIDIKDIPENIRNKFYGKTIKEIIDTIIGYSGKNIDPREVFDKREKIILKLLEDVKPLPGFDDLMRYLRSTDNISALATSSHQKYVDLIFDKFNIKNVFDVIVTADDIKSSKPDPEMFLLASKRLHIDPKNCIVFEDSDHGLKAAKLAGMKAVAVKNNIFDTHQTLKDADDIINNLSSVPELIKNL
jgi:HAD superfamily hydrolase (TIGR01509 family)